MSSGRNTLHRRALLRGTGVALALPFLEAMVPHRAKAQASTPPRRIVFLMTPNGIEIDRWKCDIGAANESRSFALSPILSELSALREKSLFIEGVPMSSAGAGQVHVQGHPKGTSAVFTGGYASAGTMYGGGTGIQVGYPRFESIDNAISRRLPASTRFPALYLGVRMLDNSVARRVFYNSAFTPASFQQDPAAALGTLLDDLQGSASERARATEDRLAAFGTVLDDYRALRCRVGATDRERLEQHMDEISALTARLGQAGDLSCETPPLGSLAPNDFARAESTFRAHIDVAATALGCGLTRVVGLQFGGNDADGGAIYSFLGHDRSWHEITHLEGEDAHGRIEGANRWALRQLAYLVSKLQNMREADGSSVFDNTTIVWTSEIGRGWSHDTNDVAWTLVGDGGGYFDTGKYIRFAGNSSVAHNRLLLHFLHMFGFEESTFGQQEFAQGGPLPGLAK